MVGSDVLRFLGDLNREAVEIINIKMSDAHIHTHVDEGLIMSESLNES